MTTIEKLQQIVREYMGNSDFVLKPDMVLLTDFEIDSYELVVLIGKVEDCFGIEISDRAIMKMKTVADIIGYIDVQL